MVAAMIEAISIRRTDIDASCKVLGWVKILEVSDKLVTIETGRQDRRELTRNGIWYGLPSLRKDQ
jgi:hypothetical protein